MTKIFVGGISPEVTADDLRNVFQRFGRIVDAVRSRCLHTLATVADLALRWGDGRS